MSERESYARPRSFCRGGGIRLPFVAMLAVAFLLGALLPNGAQASTLALTNTQTDGVLAIGVARSDVTVGATGSETDITLGDDNTTDLDDGDDVFLISPRADTAVHVDGGAHVGGDRLTVDAGGADVVVRSTAIVVGSMMPIVHTDIEYIDLTNVNDLTVLGDEGDEVILTGNPNADRNARFTLDGVDDAIGLGPTYSIDAQSFTFTGGNGQSSGNQR